MFRCIKLNVSWEPIEIVSWIAAFELTYVHDKADIIWNYPEDNKIRSQYNSWLYPSIIVLKTHVRRRPEKRMITPSLRAILMRDMYRCQYCGVKLTNTSGTRDHVIPESKGGPTTWTNLVASCRACQDEKADKSCKESGLFPKRQPKAPLLSERFMNSVKVATSYERNCWKAGFKKLGLDYLNKEETNET